MRAARTGVEKGEIKVGSRLPSELSLATSGLGEPRRVLKLPPAKIFPSGCTDTTRINPSAPAPLINPLSNVPGVCAAKEACKAQFTKKKMAAILPQCRRFEEPPDTTDLFFIRIAARDHASNNTNTNGLQAIIPIRPPLSVRRRCGGSSTRFRSSVYGGYVYYQRGFAHFRFKHLGLDSIAPVFTDSRSCVRG